MDFAPKPITEQGMSLSTAFWLVGSGFIAAATLCFVAYERLGLPWWVLALALGLMVGLVVIGLEQFVARPLERLTRGVITAREGEPPFPPPPGQLPAPLELKLLWRGLRQYQDQANQARLATQAHDTRLTGLQRYARVLQMAGRSLRPEVSLVETAPALLRDLCQILGVSGAFVVPLRKQSAVPVLGAGGVPDWAGSIREAGTAPWLGVLGQDYPVSLCLNGHEGQWAENWARRTLWVVPLLYHGRPQGLLIALPTGVERVWTREESALLEALAPMLAAGLHPPRWSEPQEAPPVIEPAADPDTSRRSKRRKQKQGA